MTRPVIDRAVEILRHETDGIVDAWRTGNGYLCARFHRRNASVRLLVVPPPNVVTAADTPYDYRANSNEFTSVLIDAIDQATQELQPTRTPLPSAGSPTFDPNMVYNFDLDHEPPLPEA